MSCLSYWRFLGTNIGQHTRFWNLSHMRKCLYERPVLTYSAGLEVYYLVPVFLDRHTCVCEKRRLRRDCAYAQARLNLCYSPMPYVPNLACWPIYIFWRVRSAWYIANSQLKHERITNYISIIKPISISCLMNQDTKIRYINESTYDVWFVLLKSKKRPNMTTKPLTGVKHQIKRIKQSIWRWCCCLKVYFEKKKNEMLKKESAEAKISWKKFNDLRAW